MSIDALTPGHTDALVRFFAELPSGDLTFVKDDVTATAVRAWIREGGLRWVATDADTVTGYAAVRPLTGWSDHVAEIRLVVRPDRRGTGLGRALAQRALAESHDAGMRKIVVELVAEQEHAIAMFASLGFVGEALLRDHIRDREGELRDLVMLAHHVDTTWSVMESVGLADELQD
ncbi:MAG TPA: GNAT family N-acetyltransferase [Aldersonia sp.]